MNRRHGIAVNSLLALAAIAAAITITITTTTTSSEPNPTPAATTQTPTATPTTPHKGRLIIPEAGLDTPLAPMHLNGDIINPPGTKAAYLIDNLGATTHTPSTGTLYVAMHALNHGHAPGNYISDTTTQTITIHPGDTIYLDTLTYRITTTEVIHKPDLSSETTLWNTTIPNRLILITCLPNPRGGTAKDNIVITARQTSN